MQIPRVTTVDITIPVDEELNITPLFDLHTDASSFNLDGFNAFMEERCKLPNHRVFLGGDTMDLVVPVDMRRYRSSVQDKSIQGRDDWANAAVDLSAERLLAYDAKYDMIIPGNHEDEFKKRHGLCVTSMLARELRCAMGGYSGYIIYKVNVKQKSGAIHNRAGCLRILYHHGAWGGKVIKGFGGARDFARGFENWHIFCYGHNHHATAQREARRCVSHRGKLKEYPAYFVCCGSWANTYTDNAGITTYAERAGYLPVSCTTPLIKAKITRSGRDKSRRWHLDYQVVI